MLQRIRDNASGPLAYAVVALISLVFGVWGIGSYFTDSPNPVIAQVGDTEITKYELQQAYDQRYQRLQQLMGENFDHDLIEPESFRRDVLNGLIQQAALSQYASEQGYRITDQGLLQALRDDRRFQVDGEFSSERYRALLSQARIAPGAYESNLRGDLQIGQVRDAVLNTSFVTHREVGLSYRLEHQKRQLAYLNFNPDDYSDQVDVTAAEIGNYYKENAGQFKTPERVKLSYIDVDRNDLIVAEKPEAQFLQALYDQEKKASFTTPERRKARHILVRIDDDTDEGAAREKIQSLVQKLDEGAEFAELAKQESDDESTAKQGGQLDWITPGTMVEGFEKALFAMDADSTSKPVRTDFGWHLIKLEGIDPAKVKPFEDEEVQAELLEIYRAQERDERYRQMTERLDSLSFEAPDSLHPLSDELELTVKTTDWLSRGDDDAKGLAKYAAVRKAAFSDSVLKDELNSTLIQLSGDRQVVVRISDHAQAQQRPLAEVEDQIRAQLRDDAAAGMARKAAEKALESLRSGESLTQVATDAKTKSKTPGWVTRDNDTLPKGLLDTLFALPHPEADASSYGLAELDTDFAVVQFKAIEEATLDSKDVVDSEKVARESRGRIAGLEFSALRQELSNDFSVEIEEDKIN